MEKRAMTPHRGMSNHDGNGDGAAERRQFRRARPVSPPPIEGDETPAEIIEQMFNAYVGRQERTAFELMESSIREEG